MSRAMNFGGGFFVILALAGTIWFGSRALGYGSFPWVLALLLAAPTLATAWVSYTKRPEGLWWLKALAALALTFVLLFAGLIALMSSGNL